ncbi:uncharacterized protein BJ171DRAFT_501208 [Polychytrium aggregatum]|uniref:uncharacterized protein n=1 Tax=Polychytrium aggregatum TaxID=110093 RepID=UPI0022FE2EE1|nr:uncharacterized protein BJ171DRAFT_501208 [Polychytrium aggregatum]KAI9205700.1 hypothetical protein BJ171DRAFT_501208 [Polychytrium aggregatum]
MFRLGSVARRFSALTPAARAGSVRHNSNSVFASDNLKKFVPKVEFTDSTTLGQIWDACYVKYRYRLIYPVIGWIGVLYYFLWIPYIPESEKVAAAEKAEKLKALEFRQN